ncbi:MAG: PilX N-terminal domain-containing pilus assembly protein [Desulfobacteraceae bacterium]|jgi:Tfp pilus assembly protein PilX|nr:PilX N-terminal domain-containing pilus assembly protein [Desulfobacteraceae bacterium]
MGAKLRALHKTAYLVNNEGGSVIIAALLVLVLLTIVGIASTSVSNTEIQIAGHTVAYQQNFYQAEGATMEAIEQLEAVSDPLLNPPDWVEPNMEQISDENIRAWDNLGSVTAANSSLDDTQYIGVYTGIVPGNTVNMGSSTIHGYRIYGRSSPPQRGTAVVQIGYLKAF